MKIIRNGLALSFCWICLLAPSFGQSAAQPPQRVAFVLKNNLGYHRMFRVEGQGIAYGFTMNRGEKTPKNWPVGSRLYFSQDGETTKDLIFTLTEADAGQTLLTDPDPVQAKPAPTRQETTRGATIPLAFRNNSFWFKKIALISYQPGEDGNNASIFTLAPFTSTNRRFPVGTKLYVATPAQVNTVMSGKRIDQTEPFLVVENYHRNRTVDLFE